MPLQAPNLIAGSGGIYPSRFVQLDSSNDFTVIQATAGSQILGVSQEGTNYAPLSNLSVSGYAAAEGENIKIYGDGDICLVQCAEAVTRGDLLESDGNGKAAPVDGSGQEYIGGIALQSGSTNEFIYIQVAANRAIYT